MGNTAASMLDDIFAYIDARSENYIRRLIDYARHPAISAQNRGIAEVSGMLVDMLAGLGMVAEAVPTAGHPMVLARYEAGPEMPTILLYGHYDVQPPEPLELWKSPPFEPTIRDGRIWGRGLGDNKGQHFAQILAIEAHLVVSGRLPCNVILLLEGEEEIGSPHIADFVRTHADRLRADLVVTADGGRHQSGLPLILYGVRGVFSFELRARTGSRDAHSGNYGGVMPNAVWKLVHLLASMKTPAGEITIAGLADPVRAATATERAAIARLPDDMPAYMKEAGLTELDAPRDRPLFDRLMFHPTLTINGLHGGYGGPGPKTVLPSEAVAKCDIRLVEAMTVEQVRTCVAEHVKKFAPDVEFVPQGGMQPSRTSMDSPWRAVLREAVVQAQGIEPLELPSMGGSLPDYVFTKILGVDAFVVPYANFDEANHAPNENLRIDCFLAGIRTGAALLKQVGCAAPGV